VFLWFNKPAPETASGPRANAATNREETTSSPKEANVASPVLAPFPFLETLRLFGACLCVAAMLVLAAVPFILISYEHWKERVR